MSTFRMRNAMAGLLGAYTVVAGAAGQGTAESASQISPAPKEEARPGYWFYKKPPEPPAEPVDQAQKPVYQVLAAPPAESELMAMHPKQFEALLESYRQNALWKMEPQTVKWYFQLQDFARRRSRAFMNVTELVMLENPSLNMQTENPMNPPGQNARVSERQNTIASRLDAERDRAALVMLKRPECGYCEAQSSILKYFQQAHGWNVREIDLNQHPEVAQRFATNYTPTTIVIFRDSKDWMPVALGVETVPRLEEGVYRALRMMRGETTPQQYTLQEHQDGGMLDPTGSAAARGFRP